MSAVGGVAKRALDLIVASIALILLSPVIALTGVVVRMRLGGPVLFVQERGGLNGGVFRLYKFRTMLDVYDEGGAPLPDEKRLTKLGTFLRSSSLDELPSLVNVLKGDISLVGPRPLRADYLPLYTDEQARRHDVRPGITGWAQVNGRNALSWEEKFELDIWYVSHRSFGLDLKILIRTLQNVLLRQGISQDGHATMPWFAAPTQSEPNDGSPMGGSVNA